MIRRVAREAAVFTFFLALAIAMTWPLARQLPTALADLGDPFVNTWILDWVCHALTHAPLDLYSAPIYYPGRFALAHSENLIGVALLVLPFHLAGVSPIAIHNIAMLLGFALSGYGMFVLARLITGSTAAALIAGVIFAFVPFKFDHLSHLQLVWSGWIPLLLAAVIAYWRRPSKKTAACVAATFVMNGLTNVHYFLFGSLTALLTIVTFAILDPRRDRRFWITLTVTFVIAGLVLVPFLIPYRILAKEYGMVRSEGEARSGSASASAWLVTTPRSIVYGKLGPAELHRHEMQLFPGLVALILATIGVVSWCGARLRRAPAPGRAGGAHHTNNSSVTLDAAIALAAVMTWLGIITDRIEWSVAGHRILSFNSADVPATLLLILLILRFRHARSEQPERWAAAVWIAIGVVGSFGMNAFFHAFLYRRIGIFAAVRAPVRWAVIAYIGLALFAAFGALALMRRRVPAVLLIALAALDLWPSIRWEQAVPTVAPVYRWLAKERIAPLIELPMAGGSEFNYLLGSTVHHLPQFNGVSQFSAPLHAKLRGKNDALAFDDEFLSLLERNGCRLIVVHVHALGETSNAIRSWLAQHLADHRLAYLRSFDHDIGGDFVFAVTRNSSGAAGSQPAVPQPAVPDGAGHLPREKLARMLAGETTHSNAIMARVESPQPGERVHGPLRVRGWTLSPFTIRRVTILVDGGRRRIDAALIDERPDVKRAYSWYYFIHRPGFDYVIPRRPRGVPRATDVQIEVEDEGGRVLRTADVLFDWERVE